MGIGESIKGAVKEQLGKVADDDNLRAEGDAQQVKGNEQERESKQRTEALAHEEKADELKRRQRALEDDVRAE